MDQLTFRRRLDNELAKRLEEIEVQELPNAELETEQREKQEAARGAVERLHGDVLGPGIRQTGEALANALRCRHEPTWVSLPPKGWQCTVSVKGGSFRITLLAQAETGKMLISVLGEFCKSSLFTRGRAKTFFDCPLRVDLDDEEIENKLQIRLMECATSCIDIVKK